MWQRHGITITVCLACSATLLGHVWLARHHDRRSAALIAASHDFAPRNGSWDIPDPDELLRSLPDEAPSRISRPRLLSPATYQTASDGLEDPADALRPAAEENISALPKSVRPLTRRQLDEQAAVREVIEEEMPETSAEERDIWFDELKSLPAEAVRDLLRVRQQMRVLSPDHQLSGPSPLLPMNPPLAAFDGQETPAQTVAQIRPGEFHRWLETRLALEQAIEWSTHNLANAATPGYKRIDVVFGDVYSTGNSTVDQPFRGRGSRIKSIRLDMTPGEIEATHRNLDCAIDGNGFLVLQNIFVKTGFCYTRGGTVAFNEQRQLCLQSGETKLLLDPPVSIPADARELTISADGVVTYSTYDDPQPVLAGQWKLATFSDATQLKPIGNGLYVAPPEITPVLDTPGRRVLGTLRQGFLEQSNVIPERELADRETWEAILRTLPAGDLPRTARDRGPSRN